MTIRECYEHLDGDFDEVLRRLQTERLVQRIAVKFLRDESFAQLESALNADDVQEAFRAAHTLKGVCGNLSFTRLARSSAALTELLRGGNLAAAKESFPEVAADYRQTAEALRAFEAEQG